LRQLKADVRGAGATLGHWVAGQGPETNPAVLTRISGRDVLASVLRAVVDHYQLQVAKALAKDRLDRFREKSRRVQDREYDRNGGVTPGARQE
jgi:hypothetical protein